MDMSLLIIRMQPEEASVPIVHGSEMPWMRYSVPSVNPGAGLRQNRSGVLPDPPPR